MKFLNQIERNTELVNANLGDADKISVVSRHLKSTVAEWFSVTQYKINTYLEVVGQLKLSVKSGEVERVQLEFVKYTPIKGSKEKYVIHIIPKAKHLNHL